MDYWGNFKYTWPDRQEPAQPAAERQEQSMSDDPLVRLPERFRKQYLSLLGPVSQDSYASQR